MKLIKKDFSDSTSVKITLIGGNPNYLCLPWKALNRNLEKTTKKFSLVEESTDPVDASSIFSANGKPTFISVEKLFDYEALKEMEKIFDYKKAPFQVVHNDTFQIHAIFKSNIINVNKENKLFSYDWDKINEMIGKTKLTAEINCYERDKVFPFTFTVKSVKDLICYQNSNVIGNICAIFDKNFVQYHCDLGDAVIADFDGNIRAERIHRWAGDGNDINYLEDFPPIKVELQEKFILPKLFIQKNESPKEAK